jgi:hypothetical protein
MKSNLKTATVVALAATVAAISGPAFAYTHKPAHTTHVRVTRDFAQSYGYAPYERAPTAQDVYGSYAGGRQPFANPDRDFDGPNTHNEN